MFPEVLILNCPYSLTESQNPKSVFHELKVSTFWIVLIVKIDQGLVMVWWLSQARF